MTKVFVVYSRNLQRLLPNWEPIVHPPLTDVWQPDYQERRESAKEREQVFCDFITDIQSSYTRTPVRIEVHNGSCSIPGGSDLDTVEIKEDNGRRRQCTPDELTTFQGYLEATIVPAIPFMDEYYQMWRMRKRLLDNVYQARVAQCTDWRLSLPAINDRQTYETECARVNVVPRSDEELATGTYGLEYGDFEMHHYKAETPYTYVESVLAQRYYQGHLRQVLKERAAEVEAKRRAGRTPTPMVECPGCRRMIPQNMMMSASLGTVCPDCYDDYSG